MSIDEVIKTCKDITNYEENCPGYCMSRTCDKCVQESEQLAKWLEELKELRTTSCGYSKEDIELNRTAMYNKAIDDFVRFANTMPTVESEDGTIRPMWLEEIAEQLKECAGNDKSI